MRILVTGGAGFIGSHVVDALLAQEHDVVVLDNFSTGHADFLPQRNGLTVMRGDCLNLWSVRQAMRGCNTVFHLQANADVRGGKDNTGRDLDQNVSTTWNVLEAMRLDGGVRGIIFASSAVVYGEPDVFPTPETYFGKQTSLYGATKLACEGMIQAYCGYFEWFYNIFRFVSWVGERYTHGVIFDFVKQLTQTSNYLEVLGDGLQEKSYLYVGDGVRGIIDTLRSASRQSIWNLGHDDTMLVRDLANIVIDEMGLTDVAVSFGKAKRGWIGDSPMVKLDTSRIKLTGWQPEVSIEEGIRRTVRYLKSHPELLC